MADGYGDYGGLPPYGYATGGAAFMSGAMPGINRTVGMLAQLPLIKQQAEQMAQQQALQNMKTLIEVLQLPDPMGSAALEQFGPKLGVDASLIATLKRGKEDQRREIADMLREAGVDTGPGAAFAMRTLQQNPGKALELWNRAREQRIQRERMAGLQGMYSGQLEVPRPEPPQGAPGAAPTAERPYPPAAYGEPPPPPAPPSVAPGAPTPTGAIAPAPAQPMPTEVAGAPWQRDPNYLRARTRVETAIRAIENENAGYHRVTSRGALDEAERKHFTEIHKQRIEGFSKQLEAAQKELSEFTPAYAGHVEVRDEINGKTVIRAISKQGERMGDIGTAPIKPQSPLGQLLEEERTFARHYGTDSPQVKAIQQQIDKAVQDKGIKPSDVAEMRKEFLSEAKPFVQVRDGYRRVQSARPTPAGDMAMIFGYMKLLDPTSAVRETEYASAENARGVPDWLRNLWNKAFDIWASGGLERGGRILTDNQVADFRAQADALYGQQLGSHRQLEQQFRGLADRTGFDPRNVVLDLVVPTGPPPPNIWSLPFPGTQSTGPTSSLPSSLATTPAQREEARAASRGVVEAGNRATAELRAAEEAAKNALRNDPRLRGR